MKKKTISLLLALALVLSLLPITALADDPPAPTFTASVGKTPLSVVYTEENGYPLYAWVDNGSGWVQVPAGSAPLYIVPVPDGTESVDLSFSDNVLAYNYTSDGTYIAGEYDFATDYVTGVNAVTVSVDAEDSFSGKNDGEPDCIQVQKPNSQDVWYAITFQPAPAFTASVGGTKLTEITKTANGYIPHDFNENPLEPVPLYTVLIPEDTETVDLTFTGNVAAYNYTADGTTFIAGGYSEEPYYTVSGDVRTVSVDAKAEFGVDAGKSDGKIDCIQVQTPYDADYNSTTLFAVTFAYSFPFTASLDGTKLTEITKTADGYIPHDYSGNALDPVPLYTLAVPAGTETVDLTFSENVLAYNYTADGTTFIAGSYNEAPYYTAKGETVTVSLDAKGENRQNDGEIDCIQVQTPYEYDGENYNTTILFAITFDDGSSSSGGGVAVTEAELLDGIAAVYADKGPGSDGNTPWIVADMITYASLPSAPSKLSEAQLDAARDSAVYTLFTLPSSTADVATKAGDAAKNIIALVAMGYDPTRLTASDGTEFSGKAVLDALAFTESGEAFNGTLYEFKLPYVIMAYRLLGDTDSLQKLIALALEIKDIWMDTGKGVDGMTPFMVALAPEYGSNSDVKTVLDKAVSALKDIQLENGRIGNAASTGLAIAGFTALGIDPHTVKNGENSLIDGLVDAASRYDGTTLGDPISTEQGFRGLVAAAKGKGYTTYAFDTADLKPAADLSVPSVAFNIQPDTAEAKLVFKDADGNEVKPVSAGVFSRLAAGTYSYTVTADGYVESSGTVTVSDDTRETVYVSLVRTAPDGSEPESNTAVVTVRVLSHDSTACGGKYTYRQNAYAYSSILGEESCSVTVVKGQDTARDVLVAALTKFHIPFTEEANGYFSMINNESEMGHGSANSGWMYLVNGVSPTVSASEYVFAGNATMIWYFTDDYTNEYGSEEWNTDPQSSGSTSAGKTGAADVDNGLITVKPEVVNGEAKAEIKGEDAAKAIESGKTAKVVTVKVDTTDAEKVETVLSAEAIKAIEKADMGLRIVTENGDVKVDAKTMAKLAETGKDVAVTVTRNSDGTTTISLTAGGENIDAKIKVELPAVSEKQILAIMNTEIKAASATLFADSADEGEKTPVILSVVKDGTIYAVIPAGATVKVVDAEPMSFGDVKTTDWFAEAVDFVSSRGIFQGTDQGFEPGKDMDRAMLAMVLYRIAGAVGGGASAFADVDPEAWYADAVAWAADAGVVKGRGEGYAPAAPVTREEIATMLYRFAQYLGVNVSGSADLSVFPDSGETSAWAKDAMAWAVSAGLFQGDDARALNPGGNATRAEVATLMERLVSLIVM